MRRLRQPLPEIHNNQDRWLLTYADMITLLTVFFLMLYSMSVMSKGKFAQLAVSVRGGFNGVSLADECRQPRRDADEWPPILHRITDNDYL